MTDLRKAAEQALEALEEQWEEHEAIDALRQALAQPEQESVICRNIYEVWAGSDGVPIPETIVEAYLLRLIEQMRDEASKGLKALYTAPPKRDNSSWVGLTDEDYNIKQVGEFDVVKFAKYIEAKLKEKNNA
jgi:hypothetical protein